MLNYCKYFDEAFVNIKSLRDPHAGIVDYKNLKYDELEEQELFNFSIDKFGNIFHLLVVAKKNAIVCLLRIVIELGKIYNHSLEYIKSPIDKRSPICFIIYDKVNKIIYYFKNKEQDILWSTDDCVTEEMIEIEKRLGIREHKFVYLLYDKANLQFMGRNDNDELNYSVLKFFDKYFGTEEKKEFEKQERIFTNKVNNYFGLILIKSLTSNAIISFRRLTESQIINFNYKELFNKNYGDKKLNISKNDYNYIYEHFIDNKRYMCLLGKSDFAESLITSEWLYDSLKKANAIDLTIIAMGYLKTIEQLLYALICLHKDNGLKIKKDYSYKELSIYIDLSDENINGNKIDTTLGSMANFYNYYKHILIDKTISSNSKKYITEAIFNYRSIRNGFLHKDNIHNWQIIENIRNETFYLLFLLIGSKECSSIKNSEFEFKEVCCYTDFNLLCEYVDYFALSHTVFFVKVNENDSFKGFGLRDAKITIIDNRYKKFSGIYFQEICSDKKIRFFDSDNMPLEVATGHFVFEPIKDEVKIKDIKVDKTIFKNNKILVTLLDEKNELKY